MTRLIGQRHAESFLARSVATDRVGHAYLFLGAAGSGKATAARLFSQAVNCARQPAATDADAGWRLSPCGECDSCRRIAAGTHPEVIEVRPDSKTGQNITVEQARLIRKNAALRPKLGRRRIYLVAQAETFNEESANALLKTLEEPSSTVTLILCAPGPGQVLPTIRSRCQVVRFGPAPRGELQRALTAGGTTPEMAAIFAGASGGRPGVALTWAGEPSRFRDRALILDLFHRALRAQQEARREPAACIACFRLAERLRSLAESERPKKGKGAADADRDEPPPRPAKALHAENLDTGLSYLRDLLLLTCGAEGSLLHNPDRETELAEMAAATTPARVIRDVESVREAQQLLDRNVQPQLVLERMFWALISGPVEGAAGLFPARRT